MIGVTSASLASFGRRPCGAGAAAARGSLATGRSRVGRACVAPLPDCQAAKASSRQTQVMARGDVGDAIPVPLGGSGTCGQESAFSSCASIGSAEGAKAHRCRSLASASRCRVEPHWDELSGIPQSSDLLRQATSEGLSHPLGPPAPHGANEIGARSQIQFSGVSDLTARDQLRRSRQLGVPSSGGRNASSASSAMSATDWPVRVRSAVIRFSSSS